MITMEGARRSIAGLALVAAVAWGSQATVSAGRLRVLIATDERAADVGEDMNKNASMLMFEIGRQVPANLLIWQAVPPQRFTAQSIMTAINGLEVDPDDAILFYYSGHGAFDPQRMTYVTASGDNGMTPLFASDIRQALEARGARLTVVMFDCCNSLRPVNGPLIAPAPANLPPVTQISPLFDGLFFQPRGVVMVESSAPGEYALVLPQTRAGKAKTAHGSLFTSELVGTFYKNQARGMSWPDVCRTTQAQVDAAFGSICPGGRLTLGTGEVTFQRGQTIMAWIDGARIAIREE
ncbi:MAG: caspase family protein [Paludisphaera borealis]|uniref:caspase family protein n=1 Tax=Paludisphaera borealis TaxID=1387353 RepID=UPI00283B2E22|nr:caspase family protein [Paludisphaera borealis]MDR3619488.1 caspase family protein [Paludisphaera borealis]